MGANAANGSHPVCQRGSPLQPAKHQQQEKTKSVVMIRVFMSKNGRNTLTAAAPPRTPLGSLQRYSRLCSWTKGKGKRGEGRRQEGESGRRRVKEGKELRKRRRNGGKGKRRGEIDYGPSFRSWIRQWICTKFVKVLFLLTLSTIFTRHSLITNNSCSIKSV